MNDDHDVTSSLQTLVIALYHFMITLTVADVTLSFDLITDVISLNLPLRSLFCKRLKFPFLVSFSPLVLQRSVHPGLSSRETPQRAGGGAEDEL